MSGLDPFPGTVAGDEDDYLSSDDENHLLADLLDSIQAGHAQHVTSAAHRFQPHELEELASQDPNVDLRAASLLDETFTVARADSTHKDNSQPQDVDDAEDDMRSPLERFRTAPKKPLSVTDLVSPAWCEMQYWYSLTKLGKVRKTPAMKRGSSIHKELEEQVHVAVRVDVETLEDRWGLRLWNIIQGLRTLRATGLTRELELWSTIDGQVINGVVDELSYNCPDPAMEAKLQGIGGTGFKEQRPAPDPSQTTLEAFMQSQSGKGVPNSERPAVREPVIYITDVKTRGVASTPKGAALRPTMMQLMLYRRLLVALATDSVNPDSIFARYKLDPKALFSDVLIQQLANLDSRPYKTETGSDAASLESDADTLAELLSHNSLAKLWGRMIEEFKLTVPHGQESVSRLLRAEYRRSNDGSIIGTRTFHNDDGTLTSYITEEMRWWKGERQPHGVDVEEAFKCRTCDFAKECTWRIQKVQDDVDRSKKRQLLRSKGSA